jgi:hypothetical protein
MLSNAGKGGLVDVICVLTDARMPFRSVAASVFPVELV